MNDEHDLERIEQLLRQAAVDLQAELPPTPPIAAPVRRALQTRRPRPALRLRLVRAIVVALAVFALLLLISPDARQAVARFFGLETVRVEFVPTLTISTLQPTNQPASQPARPPAGQTTLAEARARATFEIRPPTYPANLGDPLHVYFQDFGQDIRGAQQVILVYPDFTLYQATGVIYQKSVNSGTVVEETQVWDTRALWLTGGEHLIQIEDSSGEKRIDFRPVEGNVLAWEAGGVTYRIETTLPLDEARRVAESIR
jgi:hypothetical protein